MRIVRVDASIIIPLYNLQTYVAQTIESALNQTYRFFEVIVVNDGSTDGSLEVAQRYGDRIILINQQNAGLNASRNAGAKASVGTFLLPLDADDWIEPTYLEKTIPLMVEGVGVVSTDMDMFGEVNRLQPVGQPTLAIQKQANTMPCCSLIRRTAFDQTGGYSARPDIQAYGDWNLWIDILKRGWKVAPVAESLFHYRVRPVSMRSEVTPKHREMVDAIQRNHQDLFGSRGR
jgi:glycosyltransferase involved in cell wall biosynthesis